MTNAEKHVAMLAARIKATREHAPCEVCDAKMELKPNESTCNFIRRKCCCRKCGAHLTSTANIGARKKGARRRARKQWTPPIGPLGWGLPQDMKTPHQHKPDY